MILATTFIPTARTGASSDEIDVQNKQKSNVQIMEKQASNGVEMLDHENLTQSKILKKDAGMKETSRKKADLKKKRISSEKRDRLFGLLLLAYGGQK